MVGITRRRHRRRRRSCCCGPHHSFIHSVHSLRAASERTHHHHRRRRRRRQYRNERTLGEMPHILTYSTVCNIHNTFVKHTHTVHLMLSKRPSPPPTPPPHPPLPPPPPPPPLSLFNFIVHDSTTTSDHHHHHHRLFTTALHHHRCYTNTHKRRTSLSTKPWLAHAVPLSRTLARSLPPSCFATKRTDLLQFIYATRCLCVRINARGEPNRTHTRARARHKHLIGIRARGQNDKIVIPGRRRRRAATRRATERTGAGMGCTISRLGQVHRVRVGTDDAIAGGGQTEHGGGGDRSVTCVANSTPTGIVSRRCLLVSSGFASHTHTVRPAHSSSGLGGPNCRMGMKKMLYIVDFFITNKRIRPGFCRGG